MERKDIVLKNLAEEIKFNQHELIRISKIDAEVYFGHKELFYQDFDTVKLLSKNLMDVLLMKVSGLKENSAASLIPFGTVLIVGNHKLDVLLDLIAKAFKAGNRIVIQSDFNQSETFQFLNQSLQSVLASQGNDSDHIQFVAKDLQDTLEANLIIHTDEFDLGDSHLNATKIISVSQESSPLQLLDFLKSV